MTAVSESLAAGPHTIALQCIQNAGNVTIEDAMLSAVYVGAG